MCDEIMKPQSQADNENVLYSSIQFIYNVYNPATWSTETVPVQLNVWHKDSACPMHGLMYVWLWAWESGIARTATFDDVDVCIIQAILIMLPS